jgi:hypothetical protein
VMRLDEAVAEAKETLKTFYDGNDPNTLSG